MQKRFAPKFKIKKGDTVKVISGDDKGKSGKVLSVLYSTGRVLVEGVNKIKKHTKPNPKEPNGGIIEKEAPLNISNVMLLDAVGKTTRVGRRVENGKLVRYSKKSNETIK